MRKQPADVQEPADIQEPKPALLCQVKCYVSPGFT
jgi:hypothetical protein